MPLPDPHPGLVISYSYLWADEHAAGRAEGVKDRPRAVVLVAERAEGGTAVMVVPITHSPPTDPQTAVEIPVPTKERLGLDSERSWIVCSEVNRFLWPGVDLRRVPGSKPPRFHYGVLPPALFEAVKKAIVKCRAVRRLRGTPR